MLATQLDEDSVSESPSPRFLWSIRDWELRSASVNAGGILFLNFNTTLTPFQVPEVGKVTGSFLIRFARTFPLRAPAHLGDQIYAPGADVFFTAERRGVSVTFSTFLDSVSLNRSASIPSGTAHLWAGDEKRTVRHNLGGVTLPVDATTVLPRAAAAIARELEHRQHQPLY